MSSKNIDTIQNREGFFTDIPIERRSVGHSEMMIQIKNGKIYFPPEEGFSVVINDLKELFNESGL